MGSKLRLAPMHWPEPVLVAVGLADLTASMGNVCRAWRGCVQAAADLLGDELGKREFPMACLAEWLSHTDDAKIELRVDRILNGAGSGDPIEVDETGRWWYKLALCMSLARFKASRRLTLEMLLDRVVGHHSYAYRRHFFVMFQKVSGKGQVPMQVHRVRDLGCGRLGRSIHEVLWSTALCMNRERPYLDVVDRSESYCPSLCGCRASDHPPRAVSPGPPRSDSRSGSDSPIPPRSDSRSGPDSEAEFAMAAVAAHVSSEGKIMAMPGWFGSRVKKIVVTTMDGHREVMRRDGCSSHSVLMEGRGNLLRRLKAGPGTERSAGGGGSASGGGRRETFTGGPGGLGASGSAGGAEPPPPPREEPPWPFPPPPLPAAGGGARKRKKRLNAHECPEGLPVSVYRHHFDKMHRHGQDQAKKGDFSGLLRSAAEAGCRKCVFALLRLDSGEEMLKNTGKGGWDAAEWAKCGMEQAEKADKHDLAVECSYLWGVLERMKDEGVAAVWNLIHYEAEEFSQDEEEEKEEQEDADMPPP